MACLITGAAGLPNGAAFKSGTFSFVANPVEVLAIDGDVITPRPITVQSDASGAVSFSLLTGNYTGRELSTGVEFDFAVPNTSTADFAVCVESGPVAIEGYGVSLFGSVDADAARVVLERQDFATRAAFVTWATGRTPALGLVMRADGRAYRWVSTSTAIPDLPGWVPDGQATAVHFGADLTGATSAITAVGALLDYVNGLGGGKALMPAGTYLWPGSLTRQGLNKVHLEGEGNATKLLRSGNRTAAAIRFWGGANNRIRRIFLDCAGYAGRGLFVQDQYSGIEDCEVINCPDRPFGMQGGGNTTYGLDSAGRSSDDAAFTTPSFYPVGCYYENCRMTRCGNTAFSQKQMPHSRIQRCFAINAYSEGITIDRCDYSSVMSNTLLNVALIDTSQFPDLDAGTGFLSAGGGGVGGVGIDGSDGARFTNNTIIGVNTTTATLNNRKRAAINFVNNIQAAHGCIIAENYIADAKCGIWLKGVSSGAAGVNLRHTIQSNTFATMGDGIGDGVLAEYGAVWIDSGCTQNNVAGNAQVGGGMLITDEGGNNWIESPDTPATTPVLAFGGASVGITASRMVWRIQRFGRKVQVDLAMVLTSKGSSTGAATVSGLPWLADVNAINVSANMVFLNPGGTAPTQPYAQITGGTSVIQLFADRSFAGTPTALADTDFSNTQTLTLQISYEV